MEGESKQEEQNINTEKTPNKKVSNFQTLKNHAKKIPWPARVAASGTLVAAGVFGAVKGAEQLTEDDSSQNVTATETITPTPESTQEPQLTPIKTKEPTPTPVISSTATQTPSPETSTPTPVIVPETTSPTFVETAPPTEAPKQKNYEIVDKGITNPEYPAYEANTVEEATNIIHETLINYPALPHPELGDLKIHLILGGGSHYNPSEHILLLDRTSSDFKATLLHELVHSWDNILDDSPQTLEVINAILDNSEIGRHYPSIENLVSSQYLPALTKYFDKESNFTYDELGELASGQADVSWKHKHEWDQLINIFTPQYLENKTGEYESIFQFLQDPDIQYMIENHIYWQYINEIILSNPAKWENNIHSIYPQSNFDKASI